MKAACSKTRTLLKLCVLGGLVWSLTASFETFDPSECTDVFDDRTHYGMSYLDCVDSCKNTVECTGVSYQRRHLRCRNQLVSGVMKKCPSHVLSRKSQWRHQDGECMCPARKTCNQSGECVFSGCTKLQEPAHGKLYGNMLRIGAKVIFECKPGYVPNQTGALVCKGDGQWSGETPACFKVPDCKQSLVDKVGDDQLSHSSCYCAVYDYCARYGVPDGMTAKYARLSSHGHVTGSWSAAGYGKDEYIQVDFLEQRVVSGVALKGRDYSAILHRVGNGQTIQQYVTAFKLLISSDCTAFKTIKDESGQDKIFDGNTRPEEQYSSEKVIRLLAERVTARCVRINPTAYVRHISLRFDVLGC